MKGMKSSKVDYLEKKVANLERVLSHLFTEQQRITELAVGTLETIKHMDDYEDAIENLKKKVAEKSSKTEEVNADRATC
jgi:hypothetical protein